MTADHAHLVPPKNMAEAKAIAAYKDAAIPVLRAPNLRARPNVQTTNACLQALALIGSDTALQAIAAYRDDYRLTVRRMLWKLCHFFDEATYVKQVLDPRGGWLSTDARLSGLNILKYFAPLRTLQLEYDACASLRDLSPLASHPSLETLVLVGCHRLEDLGPLAYLPHLSTLELVECHRVRDLSPLSHLRKLTCLKLIGMKEVNDLTALSHLTNLTTLVLCGNEAIRDLRPLSHLSNLSHLRLTFNNQLTFDRNGWTSETLFVGYERNRPVLDLSALANLHHLTYLGLDYCSGIHDLSPLSSLQGLIQLEMSGCDITDLSALTPLRALERLGIADCDQVQSLTPLLELPHLYSLDLGFFLSAPIPSALRNAWDNGYKRPYPIGSW